MCLHCLTQAWFNHLPSPITTKTTKTKLSLTANVVLVASKGEDTLGCFSLANRCLGHRSYFARTDVMPIRHRATYPSKAQSLVSRVVYFRYTTNKRNFKEKQTPLFTSRRNPAIIKKNDIPPLWQDQSTGGDTRSGCTTRNTLQLYRCYVV